MFTIEIAGIAVGIQNRFRYIREICQDYMANDATPLFTVCATEEDVDEELKISAPGVPRAYAEATCIHRLIARRLHEFDAFLLHSAVISCDGEGYAFAARSGVGKSTHISLWMKNFGDRVFVVNGDKPIVRLTENGFYVYGTPWRGKEGYGKNTSCPLKALCFVERGTENSICQIDSQEALMGLFPQVYLPEDAVASSATLELIDKFVKETKFYRLKCNMEDEAAMVAYHGMNEK